MEPLWSDEYITDQWCKCDNEHEMLTVIQQMCDDYEVERRELMKPLWSDQRIRLEWVKCDNMLDMYALMIQMRDEYEAKLAEIAPEGGAFQPMHYNDPDNDGPVWLDTDGRLCWAGANGETTCLVLHGDMTVCKWVEL